MEGAFRTQFEVPFLLGIEMLNPKKDVFLVVKSNKAKRKTQIK